MTDVPTDVGNQHSLDKLQGSILTGHGCLESWANQPVQQQDQTTYQDKGTGICKCAREEKVSQVGTPAAAKDLLVAVERKHSFKGNEYQGADDEAKNYFPHEL